MKDELIKELIKVIQYTTNRSDVLSVVSSWGDTLEENEIISALKAINRKASKDRIIMNK